MKFKLAIMILREITKLLHTPPQYKFIWKK